MKNIIFWKLSFDGQIWLYLSSDIFEDGAICHVTGWLQKLTVIDCHLACNGCKKQPWWSWQFLA